MTALADQIGAWIGAQPVEAGVDGRAMLAAILERWPAATADDINLAITIGIETRTDTLWRGLLAAGGLRTDRSSRALEIDQARFFSSSCG